MNQVISSESDLSEIERDAIEVSDHNTETDILSCEDELQQAEDYVGKDKTVWKSKYVQSRARAMNIMTNMNFGPTDRVKMCKTETECFFAFLNKKMLDILIRHTNEEISRKRVSYKSEQNFLGD